MKVFVKSHTDGFRRCGVAHTREGREFPDGFFSEEQLMQLNDDPEITMVAGVVDDEAGIDQIEGDKIKDMEEPNLADLAAAAGQAIEDGNTIASGAPSVEAMEEILGYSITSEQRAVAWAAWKNGNK